jgi:hypothetical protein
MQYSQSVIVLRCHVLASSIAVFNFILELSSRCNIATLIRSDLRSSKRDDAGPFQCFYAMVETLVGVELRQGYEKTMVFSYNKAQQRN